jgi:very-short-patch-repair endonuclease
MEHAMAETRLRRLGAVVCNAPVTAAKRAAARQVRQRSTETERAVWELLRGRRLDGLKFRRQQVIAGFVVDFYCADRGIAIELDGGVHDQPGMAEADAERSAALLRRGVRVVRIRNKAASIESIRHAIAQVR